MILELVSGKEIKPPAANGLLHDTEGKVWPRNVVLLGPFRRGGKAPDDEVPSRVRQYLGRTATVRQGGAAVDSLPRGLGEWERVGDLAVIYYCRGGTKGPGCAHHRLNKSMIDRALLGRGKVTVYKHGSWYRLQFPRNARIDDRGFGWP